jgi:hypothetical protein
MKYLIHYGRAVVVEGETFEDALAEARIYAIENSYPEEFVFTRLAQVEGTP